MTSSKAQVFRVPSLNMSAGAPWDVNPALKQTHLATLARLAVEARWSALADAKREEGDTNWGIGCRAYERFVHRVVEAAKGAGNEWLGVLRDGLSVIVLIEGVPVRAFTGRADKPDPRHVHAAQIELEIPDDRQLALPFFDLRAEPSDRWGWLMAVETDDHGRPARVVFFQADSTGRTRNAWSPPMEEIAPAAEATKGTDARRRRGRPPAPPRSPVARPLFADAVS